jgi:hypothetical protein
MEHHNKKVIHFKGGKKEPKFQLSSKSYDTLGAMFDCRLPPTPAYMDHSVPGVTPMFMNDQLGCCTISTIGHILRSTTYRAWGSKNEECFTVPDALINSTFTLLGGNGDSGLYVVDVLNYWHTKGMSVAERQFEDVIAGYVPLKVTTTEELDVALDLFDAVYCGWALPQTAMDQFNSGEEWHVVNKALTGSSAVGSLGGHATPLVKRDKANKKYATNTWGSVHDVSEDFVEAYLEEAYAVIPSSFLMNPSGKTPEGFDIDRLKAQMPLLLAA